MAKKIKNNSKKLLAVSLIVSVLGSFLYFKATQAASLTALSDTMSRVKTGELSDHDIKFRTPGGMSSSTITIDLGTSGGFAKESGLDYTDIDLQYGSSQAQVNGSCSSSCTKATLAGSSGDSTWGATMDGSSDLTLSYPSSNGTAIATNDYVRVLIGTNATTGTTGDKQMTNPSTGTKTFTVNVAGTTDTGKIADVIITNDQIPVTATVNPTLSFTVANTTLALGVLASNSIATTGYNNITIGTNGTGGYTISVKDIGNNSSPGLYNSTASKLIASADASPLTTDSEGYGGQCNKVGGSGSCTFTGTSDNVNGFTLTGGTFASYGSKPSGTDTFQIRVKATIATSTEPGSYADTLTLIATGNF